MSEAPLTTTSILDEEGEAAADYLEELLDIADLDGDIEIDVRAGRACVEIVAEDNKYLDGLVGRNGETLDALQDLTRMAVQNRTGEHSRLMLDIAGFREGKRTILRKSAEKAIAEVIETGTEVSMPPGNAFNRKVIHDAVAAAGLVSDSRGLEPKRYVVIKPALTEEADMDNDGGESNEAADSEETTAVNE
ncbi:MAG: single-stranded DNA-binding protein [Cellulomonadaceae bacterium]|jgi:spoIIIJ-associated protein|nr:single-stranded DNA-binding protein [Cellulomonadaceae bacterium]